MDATGYSETQRAGARGRLTAGVLGLLLAWAVPGVLYAAEVQVAVAANFSAAAQEIGVLFAEATGHTVRFSFASSGQLYAQITQGAPFDVFLAADRRYPMRAVRDGHAVAGSGFTYASGRLVLFSADAGRVTGSASLETGEFTRLAIANPALAPYGAAAVEVLAALDLSDRLRSKLVRGNNVAQTYQFVITGNAELGFVALSQVISHGQGSRWIVPRELHSEIAQDAVLLHRGADNEVAQAFLAFLRGLAAAAVKARYGYG
jgi:molybdate transport system substrate-binding protein